MPHLPLILGSSKALDPSQARTLRAEQLPLALALALHLLILDTQKET